MASFSDTTPIREGFGGPVRHDSSNANSFSPPVEDPELVEPADKYLCPIHGGILQNPVQTQCGHRLCRACVDTYLGGETSKPCPVMDEEVQEVSQNTIYPDPGFQREIKQLPVYCLNKQRGCDQKIKYRDFVDHVKSCPFRPMDCSFRQRGCLDVIAMKFHDEHRTECGYRPLSCPLCVQEFNAKDIEDHKINHCPEGTIACPYKCGIKKLKRKMLDDHRSMCPMKPSECQYKALGCDFTGDKSAVENHQKNVFKHFDYMVTFLIKLEGKLKETLKNQVQLKKLQETENRDLKLKAVSHTEKYLHLEKKMEEMAQEQRNIKGQIVQLYEKIEQINGQRPDHHQSTDHSQLSRIEIRLAEMDLRFQMIETANYNGILLWKIRDFSIRRRDADQGRTVSLYSQPFYSSRFGYKMCARVYLNGDGIGKGTHLSLYFVVMKGEYDALLPWPFGLKITMLLLDQSPNKRHMKDEFVPDPNSTSFHRPVIADMNVASGCPLFVAHAVLDEPRNQYVKDDMLFIKVNVDCSQLPRI